MCKHCRYFQKSVEKKQSERGSSSNSLSTICTLFRKRQKASSCQFYHFFNSNHAEEISKRCENVQICAFFNHVESTLENLDLLWNNYNKCFPDYVDRSVQFCKDNDIIVCSTKEEVGVHLISTISVYPLRRVLEEHASEKAMKKIQDIFHLLSRSFCLSRLRQLCDVFERDSQVGIIIDCIRVFISSCEIYSEMFFEKEDQRLFQIHLLGAIILFRDCLRRLLLEKKDFVCTFLCNESTNEPILMFSPLIPVSCRTCGSLQKLFQCEKCHHAMYCSVKCQQRNWSTHKADCSLISFRFPRKSFYEIDNHPLMQVD